MLGIVLRTSRPTLLLELFGIPANTFLIVLLIKFLFPCQLQVKLTIMPQT
jgi:hypothetical protein